MTCFHTTTVLLLLVAAPLTASAATVYQCEDASGQRTFQDRCPPGTKVVMESRYGRPEPAAAGGAQDAAIGPVTLYVVPDCESCEEVREFLQLREVEFEEVNVADDVEMQNRLKKVSGQLRVPTTVIGGRAVIGYNRGELAAALTGGDETGTAESPDDSDAEEGFEEEAEEPEALEEFLEDEA